MDESRDAEKIAFAPHFDVRVIDERRILLLAEDRSFLLTGKLYVAIAPYLDGSRTRAQIIEALRPAAPRERLELAMSNLLTKKYAAPVADGVPVSRAAFWTELELAPDGAERRVRQTPMAVRALGRRRGADGVAAGQLTAELAEAGFSLAVQAAGADLTVVLVDDYLDPQLDEVNRQMRTAGRRWLPVKAAGRVVWIGPIFRPADGPCWACLAKRISENRPGEMRTAGGKTVARIPRADFPAGRGLAVHLAVLELARATAGVPDAALAGDTLLTFDLKAPGFTRHVVHRQVACPVCGGPPPTTVENRPLQLESRRKHPMADGGSRTCSPEEALARLEPHVSPLVGIIGGLVNQSLADGLPVYGTRQIFPVAIGPRENRRIGRPEGAAGKGTTDMQARVSCLAEAIERYSTGWQGIEPRRRATLAELGEAAVHPALLMNYSERQYAERETWNKTNSGFNWIGEPFREEDPIDWTPVWSLTHERVRWLPTQFCYYNYHAEPGRDFYRAESNGCASGSTLEEAILQGFLELVERDSCALWWYNRARRPAIDLASFADPFFRRVEMYLRAKDRCLYALDLTSDLGIPVVAAISHGPVGEKIVCGLGAHLNPRIAASRAVAELNQMLALEMMERDGVKTDDDHAFARWMREATTENQPYVLPIPGRALTAADYPVLETDDLLGDIKECMAAAQRAGLEMLVLDVTRPEVGFSAVRVTVPGLRHFWARFGPGRLYDVPVSLGWLERPRTEAELNPTPFFL